jgi:hypothetical protein
MESQPEPSGRRHLDPFEAQPGALFQPGVAAQADRAAGIDHPVPRHRTPGEDQAVRQGRHRPAGGARAVRQAGQSRDLSVGRHPAARDAGDDRPDSAEGAATRDARRRRSSARRAGHQ